jgi:hypothetical protein
MKSTFTAVLLLVYAAMSFTIHAATYYVSLSGNNNNTGTSALKPWQSLWKVNSKSFNGDTILFQGGSTFLGKLYFDPADVGTSSKPIVIGSYGTGRATINSDISYGVFLYNTAGFKIKNLIFKGSGRTTSAKAGILLYIDKDSTTHLAYIRIDSVEVYGHHDPGISIGSWKYKCGYDDISITNSVIHDNGSAGIKFYAQVPYVHKNIYIGYNKVYNNPGIDTQTNGNSGSGILVGGVNGAVVEYCTSYNNGWLHSNIYGGPNGIWAYESNNVLLQYNESHHNKTGNTKDGGGFDFDGGCINSTMQYNYSHDNYGGGYLLAQYSGAVTMKNITIRYNISENDGRKNNYGAIHLWASGSSGGIQSVDIYNNVIYITPSLNATPMAFLIRSGGISSLKVRNNIFQTTGAVPLLAIPYTSSSFYFQGNDYWSTGSTFKITWGSSTYSSLTSWRTATPQEKINGSATGFQSDPQFADTTTGVTFSDARQITQLKRYKLKSTSGLINKGLNLYSMFGTNVGTRDFWGNSLANKTSFNIGAYQLTTGAKPGSVLITANSLREPAGGSQVTEAALHTFPNPFRESTSVNFVLPTTGNATILLYNSDGKLIKPVFTGGMKAGEYKKQTLNAAGLIKGVYIMRMFSNGKITNEKIIIN